MSTTSQKHRNFVSEPMGNKAVTELAGIGPVLGQRLEAKGYAKASAVLGMYLSLGKDRTRFVEWLKVASGANNKQANDCYQCLHDWCQEFV
ncbi:barrier-to-autointegration factor-like [Haemaphysalis longicornis]